MAMTDRLRALLCAGGAIALVSCAAEDTGAAAVGNASLADGEICVDIPEGYYAYQSEPDQFTPVSFVEGANYTVRDGQLVLVMGEAEPLPEPEPAPEPEIVTDTALSERISSGFADLGFDWMGLDIKGRVATLTGTAPTPEAKSDAYRAGRDAIAADPVGDRVTLVVDGIGVDGGQSGVGAALAALGTTPDLEACRTAFIDTMQGRNIQFDMGASTIDPVSASLLDALTGVAILCTQSGEYEVEVGGHTDKLGFADSNLVLSQERADAVRRYLIGKGVDPDVLIAVGYGDTQLLTDENTPEANAMNRRTEFKLRER